MTSKFIGKPAFKKIFLHSKAITYLISFPTGELANDAKVFLEKEELMELVTTHHDKVHGKTWEVEYKIKRIDEQIVEKEKNSTKTRKTRKIN